MSVDNGIWGPPWEGGQGWYTGGSENPADQTAALFPIAIGSREYLIDPAKMKWETVPPLRPSMDQAPEPGEVSLNNAGLWRRSQSDWRHGSNQLMFDEADSKRTRYWTSKGINPHPDAPSNAYQLRLHKDVQQSRTSASGNFKLLVANGHLYVVDGAEMYWTTALSGGTTVWSAAGISAASGGVAITGATTDGAYVYAAVGAAGVIRSAIGATAASPWLAGGHSAAKVNYVNGRMLVASGGRLSEVNASGQIDGDQPADIGTLSAQTGTSPITTLACSPTQSLTSGQSVTVNYGGHTQVFTTSAAVSAGAANIPINSATPTFNFPAGTQVVASYTAATGLMDFTHPVSGFAWGGALSTPHGIFCFGSSGIAGEMYLAGVDNATGAMNNPQSMFILPVGETLNAAAYYSGAMILGTSAGIRVATVLISFVISVQYGPVILVSGGVNDVFGYGQWAYFAWSNYDTVSTGLGRLDLARFAADLTPSMSSDLMAPTQGQVLAVCDFAGVRCFAVSGVGVYNEHPTNYVTSGTIDVGRIKYGTTEPKLPLFVDLYHAPLPVGASIGVDVVDDFATVHTGGSSATTDTLHPASLIPLGVSGPSEHVELQLTINNGTDLTNPPVLRRWTLFSIVAPHRVDQIDVPIRLHREEDTAGSGPPGDHYQDVLDNFTYLKGLEASQEPVSFRCGDINLSVYIAAVKLEPDRWDAIDNHFLEGLLTVSLVTLGSVTSNG